MHKKVLLLDVRHADGNYLVSARLAQQRSVVLEIGPEQARLLCLALTPALRSATLESIGQDIAKMLSIDTHAEVPFG